MTKTRSFSGGVHPIKNHKDKLLSSEKPIIRLKPPQEVIIPISQHLGAPAKPIVSAGDTVLLGQKIAEATSFVSANIHSSVSGKVKSIENRPHLSGAPVLSIVIENDGNDTPDTKLEKHDLASVTARQIVEIVKEAGIVGMGGASFPTHVKLSPPADRPIEMVILNAAECEPYLTTDHRLILENTQGVIEGLQLIQKAVSAKKCVIAIEDNKPDAVQALKNAIASRDIQINVLKAKYPQGAEKQIIRCVAVRDVPSGGLPHDVGVLVSNTATAFAVYQAVVLGIPAYERVVTVTGCVKEPSNFLCRVGTPLSALVEAAGGFSEPLAKIISGGPMMGIAINSLDIPVMKATSGILALDAKAVKKTEESNCIRCGRCIEVCPIGLQPLYIYAYASKNDFAGAEKLHAADCIECGCCSYICPAKRYLSQSARLAKTEILKSRKKK